MLSFEYPTWYLLFCLLAGLAYALVLYYRDTAFREQSRWLVWLLGILRAVAVTVIAILLLSPLLRYLQTNTQQPIIVLAQDISESVGAALAGDSSTYRAAFEEVSRTLGQQYEVHTYTFGSEVTENGNLSFVDKKTNISALMREIGDLYGNQNLGAIVLATDGIYNEGSNPAYANLPLNAPVYTVALGDTTRQRDLVLRRVFHNRIAYLGDQFSIQIDVSAQNAAGSRSTLSVSRVEGGGSRRLREQPINIDRNDFFVTHEFLLDADRAGVQRYRVSLTTISGETNVTNNVRDIFVEVLDARQKILILADAPHPDITALRQSLDQGLNNEVTVDFATTFRGNAGDFDLLILHQLPSRRNAVTAVTNVARERGIPTFYISGQQSNYVGLNALQTLVNVRANGQATNEVQGQVAGDFSLFTLSDELRSFMNAFPPLEAPFGEFTVGTNASTLLYQRIGRVDTRYPLLVLGEQGQWRQGLLLGTGLWQWRLFDYLEHQNHQRFDEMVSKVTQYLSVKNDKRRFRVTLPENIFDENEPVSLDAELYNNSYELINEPDVTIVITDEAGKDYNYTFNRSGKSYSLRAGVLPVGNYRYQARVNTGTENLTASGQFSVQPVQLELYETTADHTLLRLLSDRFGGEMIYADQLASLPTLLSERGTVKPVIYQTVTTRSVINLKWIFFALLFLLTLEWFLRRYFGAY